MRYKNYHIEHNPPPIPVRSFDWQFWHDEYDGPGDNRHGSGATLQDCQRQIDEQLTEEE